MIKHAGRIAGLLTVVCLAAVLAACAKVCPETIANGLVVRFLDVGQGDSIFITLPDGSSMLIDTGAKSVGGSVVAIIRELGVKKIDRLILTHPHEDHIGGATAVLKAFDIGQVWMPRASHTTQTYEDLLLSIEAKGLGIDEAKAGKVLMDNGNLKAWFLNPSRAYDNLNNCSAVLALKYGDKTFLFEGDAEKEAEEAMTLSPSVKLPDVDVLKVAHHGSSSSSTKAFLNMVSPEIAVISVGAGNDYGHPAKTTLNRLKAIGARIYRTDRDGTVTITTDGSALRIKMDKKP